MQPRDDDVETEYGYPSTILRHLKVGVRCCHRAPADISFRFLDLGRRQHVPLVDELAHCS